MVDFPAPNEQERNLALPLKLLQRGFVESDMGHEESMMSLSVQLYTVPSIVAALTRKYDLPVRILDVFEVSCQAQFLFHSFF